MVQLEGADGAELTNEVVTVSLLQVALRSDARRLQVLLNEWGETADTATPEGLFSLLQQVAQGLLDYSRYWSHVLASSKTVNAYEEAEEVFNAWSLRERSKFSTETLTNVDGVITKRSPVAPSVDDTPAYIVVTLILGTEGDLPLFSEIYSASALRDVLDNIRMMQPLYLIVFEMLWSPQDLDDSLTEAERVTEYGDMSEIA
ncbi:DUF1517 domain-containing protein [Phormidium sp. CLA17]|uniref:DUF1517 domain-containing protein n=1 Tax=Leptolyngbya sp. Cla-17 TaxID=2803751 RepID=UPI001492A50B|nr:DUF1517 domain-containing protein [Leptolyngbya sp. Cla-17]MBM0742993.1 DUF1517 domain-containing protein [Leptolyngbya sp. Cla-17]